MLNTEDKIVTMSVLNKAFDRLAIVFDNGFSNIHRRFDLIDGKFDEIDKKFIRIDERFDEIDQRFVDVYERFDNVDEKLLGLQSQITGTNNRIDSHVLEYARQDQHNRLEKRVVKLEMC